MENNKQINWEKIGVYLTFVIAFFTMVSYVFHLKDESSSVKERTAKLEVKVEHLEKNNE